MNVCVCRDCEYSYNDGNFNSYYYFMNLENKYLLEEANKLNDSLDGKLFNPEKDVFFYFNQMVCGFVTFKDSIIWSKNTSMDDLFLFLYEKNLLDYFIIKNKKDELLEIEIKDKLKYFSMDKNNKIYFRKTDKNFDYKERSKIIEGIEKYFKLLDVNEDCPYFFEQVVLAEGKDVL